MTIKSLKLRHIIAISLMVIGCCLIGLIVMAGYAAFPHWAWYLLNGFGAVLGHLASKAAQYYDDSTDAFSPVIVNYSSSAWSTP